MLLTGSRGGQLIDSPKIIGFSNEILQVGDLGLNSIEDEGSNEMLLPGMESIHQLKEFGSGGVDPRVKPALSYSKDMLDIQMPTSPCISSSLDIDISKFFSKHSPGKRHSDLLLKSSPKKRSRIQKKTINRKVSAPAINSTPIPSSLNGSNLQVKIPTNACRVGHSTQFRGHVQFRGHATSVGSTTSLPSSRRSNANYNNQNPFNTNTDTKFEIHFVEGKCYFKGLLYIGPTSAKKPRYKSKQSWEWNMYPHGVSKLHGKLRIQIKQRGFNPSYPLFPNTLKGLLDAALYRDYEIIRLWVGGVLIRSPKFNFFHKNTEWKKMGEPMPRGGKRGYKSKGLATTISYASKRNVPPPKQVSFSSSSSERKPLSPAKPIRSVSISRAQKPLKEKMIQSSSISSSNSMPSPLQSPPHPRTAFPTLPASVRYAPPEVLYTNGALISTKRTCFNGHRKCPREGSSTIGRCLTCRFDKTTLNAPDVQDEDYFNFSY
ncbi:hypothetical protein AAMO2058_000585700 [Amorphochlora amoebiformis]